MSRTFHHRGQKDRHFGRDLWSKRPLSQHEFTAENKRLSRKIERSWFKRDDYKEVQYHLAECVNGYICNSIYDIFCDLDCHDDYMYDNDFYEWMDETEECGSRKDWLIDPDDLYFDYFALECA